jgi:hypothetical protein
MGVRIQVVIPAQAGIYTHGCPPKFIPTKVGVGMTFTDRLFVHPRKGAEGAEEFRAEG